MICCCGSCSKRFRSLGNHLIRLVCLGIFGGLVLLSSQCFYSQGYYFFCLNYLMFVHLMHLTSLIDLEVLYSELSRSFAFLIYLEYLWLIQNFKFLLFGLKYSLLELEHLIAQLYLINLTFFFGCDNFLIFIPYSYFQVVIGINGYCWYYSSQAKNVFN